MIEISSDLIIIGTAVLVAANCASIGAFLVLRQMAMMSDAISHAVLLGIVIAVFMVGGRETVSVIVGGVLSGILTVSIVEMLYRTGKLKQDSSIGIVFPFLFAIGVILVTQAGNVHIDAQHVLYGSIEFVPFDTLYVDEINIGSKSLWVLGILAIANISFIAILYKELKISTFDASVAVSVGLMPMLIHYLLMIMVATTAVVAFESVGAVLVIAFFIVPASGAYLLTDKLSHMIILSVTLGMISAIAGYMLAIFFDVSIAGSMAAVAGAVFGLIWVFAPNRGLISRWRRISKQRFEIDVGILITHIYNEIESKHSVTLSSMSDALGWTTEYSKKICKSVQDRKLIEVDEQQNLHLTASGNKKVKSYSPH
ncbi:metal ABC transporter permease [Nitrosopumilus sp. b2]|uniref:metal ABC transporter permease n=1 Tax=Nitrosopumilus sp. b2 TaxID=2109908 RepID=UPI0015F360B5|nr:metal ABC transporter permease [Nitrosopumilus sp. b2]KAF6245366.1 metal ABC transporter permease [Nitrosopumilus sp. b2]